VLPPALAEGDLGRHYVNSLVERTETLAEVIEHLASRDNLPAVFHCTAGKDRTGMVAALVLSLVGVPDDVIVHDYTLTDDRMALVMERIRASGDFPEPVTPLLERVGRAEAASMETFLAAVRETHGDAQGWARDAGLSDDTLASLHAVLVTDVDG
jgi:protein tyrosine/serine phosphatase